MKPARQERGALKAAFQKMSLADKADYIWTYYKLPIALGAAALFLLCSAVYRQVTKKRPFCIRPMSMSLPAKPWKLN